MIYYGVTYFIGEVESRTVLFKPFNDSKALARVGEIGGEALLHHDLSGVPEGSVAEIVPQRGCLCEILVEIERSCYGPCYLRDLESMRQAGTVMISERCEKDLCLVHQSAEGLTVYYAVTVALKFGSE